MCDEVKRYDIGGFGRGMVEAAYGAFYHMDDYDALRTQVDALKARQVPEGWKVDRRELDGAICFIIGTPHKNGVRVITSVFESDDDPAHLLLWHLLAAAQQAEQAGGES